MANSADPDQKPTDLDLHCLQRQGISGFSRTRADMQMGHEALQRTINTRNTTLEQKTGRQGEGLVKSILLVPNLQLVKNTK